MKMGRYMEIITTWRSEPLLLWEVDEEDYYLEVRTSN